jgi:hypothetical protein
VKINPAPWEAVQIGSYVKVVDASGGTVSDIRLSHHPADAEPIGWNNACLIAAAPELLAACVEVEAWIAETMRDKEELSEDAQAILATVRAAIARAGGAS